MARDTLISIGLLGCLASLITEAAIQARSLGGTNKSVIAAGVAMLYSYVFFYAMFLDGCSFWYVGEIFPSHLRANGFALAMAGFCLADIIVSKTLLLFSSSCTCLKGSDSFCPLWAKTDSLNLTVV
jgi:hypothetical protein